MIAISTENRLKEIAGNLKRDVKDLLDESAGIVTRFFKNGLFTANGVTNCWKTFTRGLSYTVKAFTNPDELPPLVCRTSEPLVTIKESDHEELPAGTQMPLFKAEQLIKELNQRCIDFDEPDRAVKVVIDYRMDGQQDRYWLPLQIGQDQGTLLEQMRQLVESNLKTPDRVTKEFYNASPGLGELLHEYFDPHIHESLERLGTRILNYFQQHCTISQLEQQFDAQAEALSEKDQKPFRESAKTSILRLRYAVNEGQDQPIPQHETPERADLPNHQREKNDLQRPRRSVKIQLQQIKDSQSHKPIIRKSRKEPQR